MKKRTASLLAVLLLLFSSLPALAQDADFMRSTGKIYVVVAVILAIFIGLVIYLIRLDRKLTKLENQIEDHD
jgi:CcmD family protein